MDIAIELRLLLSFVNELKEKTSKEYYVRIKKSARLIKYNFTIGQGCFLKVLKGNF